MAVIVNTRENPYGSTLMSGTGQADSIFNNYDGVKAIDAMGGNDTIDSRHAYVSINGGTGDDYMEGWRDTFIGGEGDDTIRVIGYNNENSIIQYSTGDGNDVIDSYNNNYTIQLLGDTTITGATSNDDEADYSNYGDVAFQFGTGSITVKYGINKPINFSNEAGKVTSVVYNGTQVIEAIRKDSYYDLVEGTDDDDLIIANYTTKGGKGNDTIYSSGEGVIQYAEGDGNDVVLVYNVFNTNTKFSGVIEITSGEVTDYKIINNGSNYGDHIIQIGTGSITLKQQNDNSVDIITKNPDGSDNFRRYVNGRGFNTVSGYNGTNDDDYISYTGSSKTIDGKAGNDYINGDSASNDKNNTIIGGLGNDTIHGHGSYNVIIPGAGNNSISGAISYGTVIGGNGTGRDTIEAYGSSALIDYSESNGDNYFRITNTDSNYTIIGGSGNDTINYYIAENSSINGGAGNDNISAGENSTIIGGKGDDTLHSSGGLILYSLGDGNDVILSGERKSGYNGATIQLTNGAIVNNFYSDYDEEDNDRFKGIVFNIGTTGSLRFNPNSSLVYSKNDNNIILGSITYTYDEQGKNRIPLSNLIEGTDYADFILNNNNKTFRDRNSYDYTYIGDTINAGAGDDTIQLVGNNLYYSDEININSDIIQYGKSDGRDIIIGYTERNVIQLLDGAVIDNVSVNGSDIILTIGSGSITLKDAKGKIVNLKDSSGSNSSFYIDGQDTVKAISSFYDSIIAGDDVDEYIAINSKRYSARQVTVNAGRGNDTIVSKTDDIGLNIKYAEGDGNDLVLLNEMGLNLALAEGTSVTGYSKDGNDYTLQIGTGSITFRVDDDSFITQYNHGYFTHSGNITNNGKTKDVMFINGKTFNRITDKFIDGSDEEYYIDDGTEEDEYIVATEFCLNDVVDGKGGDDFIHSSCFTGKNVNGGTGNDTIIADNYSDITLDGGAGNDLIQNIGNESFYYIDDEEEGKEHFVEPTVIINGGAGNDIIENESYSYTMTGSIEHATGRIENINYKNEAGKLITINGGTGDDTIRNLFFNKDYEYVYEGEDGDGDSTVKAHFNNATNTRTIVKMEFYYGYDETTDKDGMAFSSSTSVQKLLYNRVIQYANGDGNDVIEDYNNGDIIQITEGTYTTSTISNDVIITVGEGSIKLLNAKGKNINIQTGSGLEKVTLTNKDKSPYVATSMVGTIDGSQRTKSIKITGNANGNSIVGGTKNDTIIGGVGSDTLTGGKGNDKLTGNAGYDIFTYADGDGKDVITDYTAGQDKVQLTSGTIKKVAVSGSNVTFTIGKGSIKLNDTKGHKITVTDKDGVTTSQAFGDKSISIANGDGQTIDTTLNTTAITLDSSARTEALNLVGNSKSNVIQLGSGDNTITSGKGKDTIGFNGGDAVITDYTAGQDKLKFNASISSAVESGNDVVFTLGTSKVTVQGAKDKKITIIDKDNQTTSQVYGATEVKLSNSDGATINVIDPIKKIDASKRTKAISIIANDSANTIIGGKGKDTLTGGKGADTFVYTKGYGNDLITDYSATENDIIQLGTKTQITGANYDGDNLILSIGKGKLTVQGGASQNVTVVDENDLAAIYTKYNRNSTANFEERWFLDNSECGMHNSELDSIIDNKSDIAVDYKFDEEKQFKKVNQAFVTNSIKSRTK